MKKHLISLLSAAVLAVVVVSCAPAPATQPVAPTSDQTSPTAAPTPGAKQLVPLKVGVFYFTSYSPLYIAKAEGYFEDEGLDVELVNFGTGSDLITAALASRQLDAAGFVVSAGLLNAITQGNDIKVVADKGFLNPDNCVTDAWMASKQALAGGLTDPSTLKGRTMVFPPGGFFEYVADKLLAEGGLTQADINFENIEEYAGRIEGLRSGAVDVSLISEPWIGRVRAEGAGEVWVPFTEVVPNETNSTIIFGPTILEDKPEIGAALLAAYLRGVQQFNEGKTDRNVQLIADFTSLDPEAIKAACWTSFSPDGSVNTDGLLAFQQWALEKGYLDKALELNQFYDPTFLTEAAKLLDH